MTPDAAALSWACLGPVLIVVQQAGIMSHMHALAETDVLSGHLAPMLPFGSRLGVSSECGA